MADLLKALQRDIIIKERSDSVDSGLPESDDSPASSPVVSFKAIKQIAIAIGVYVTLSSSNLAHLDKNYPNLKEYKKSLSTLVNKVLEENRDVFRRMIKSLNLNGPQSSKECIRQVANQLFLDNKINWGRIVTLYAFCGELAHQGELLAVSSGENNPGKYSVIVGETVGSYVGEELSDWIDKEGGWDRMVTYAKKENPIEDGLLKGLACAIFSVGVFAVYKVIR